MLQYYILFVISGLWMVFGVYVLFYNDSNYIVLSQYKYYNMQ